VGLAIAAPLLGWPLVLMPIHLVWLELIVHPVSALVFEAEPLHPEAMRRPPRDPRAPILPRRLVLISLASGLCLAAAALAIYGWALPDVARARSLAVTVVITGGLVLVWAERALGQSWRRLGLPRGARFWIIVGLEALSLPTVVYVPALARALHLARLGALDWGLACGAGVAAVAWRALSSGGAAKTAAPSP
jgi:Ca2+-transporting ATPase